MCARLRTILTRTFPRFAAGTAVLCGLWLCASGGYAAEVTYADLAPIVAARCVVCHSGVAAPLSLQLDSLENLLSGSQNGLVVNAGDPSSSELIRRIKGLRMPRMPMTGPPDDREAAHRECGTTGTG